MIRRTFLLVSILVCGIAARADQQWVEVDSSHFSVATDGCEKRSREVAQRFEQMRTAFGVIFKKVSVNTAPLQIIAFRNAKELRQFAPLYGASLSNWQASFWAMEAAAVPAPTKNAST